MQADSVILMDADALASYVSRCSIFSISDWIGAAVSKIEHTIVWRDHDFQAPYNLYIIWACIQEWYQI